MTKEDYMHLPKERLAELLAERDVFNTPSPIIPQIIRYNNYRICPVNSEPCSNPFGDCINCPYHHVTCEFITNSNKSEPKSDENYGICPNCHESSLDGNGHCPYCGYGGR